MPLNEKKILEQILTLRAANNVVTMKLNELEKELSYVPKPVTLKKAQLHEEMEQAWIKRKKNQQRKLQTQ